MPSTTDARTELTDILVAVVACDPADVVEEARLKDLGVDSLALVEVADELGRRFERHLDDATVDSLVTVADAVRAVTEADPARSRRVSTTLHSPPPPERSRPSAAQRGGAMSKIAVVFVVLGAAIGLFLGLGGAAFVAATGLGDVDLPPIAAPEPTVEEPEEEPEPEPEPEPTEEPEEEVEEPTFEVTSNQVAPGQRFGLSGAFPELDAGEVLQVQIRREGGEWEDFPVTATTRGGGEYRTNVFSSNAGEVEFRMAHRGSDTRTDPETVVIG